MEWVRSLRGLKIWRSIIERKFIRRKKESGLWNIIFRQAYEKYCKILEHVAVAEKKCLKICGCFSIPYLSAQCLYLWIDVWNREKPYYHNGPNNTLSSLTDNPRVEGIYVSLGAGRTEKKQYYRVNFQSFVAVHREFSVRVVNRREGWNANMVGNVMLQ